MIKSSKILMSYQIFFATTGMGKKVSRRMPLILSKHMMQTGGMDTNGFSPAEEYAAGYIFGQKV